MKLVTSLFLIFAVECGAANGLLTRSYRDGEKLTYNMKGVNGS
jgi:hypothetical protein